jgi:hypothetical protein
MDSGNYRRRPFFQSMFGHSCSKLMEQLERVLSFDNRIRRNGFDSVDSIRDRDVHQLQKSPRPPLRLHSSTKLGRIPALNPSEFQPPRLTMCP